MEKIDQKTKQKKQKKRTKNKLSSNQVKSNWHTLCRGDNGDDDDVDAIYS